MNMKIEKIRDAELQINKLVAQEKKMRRDYLADGTIDAKEQKQLDGVTGKMGQLKGAVAKIRAEIEAARRAWEGRATDYAQAKADLADLAAWGHAEHPKLKAEADKIEPLTKDQSWEEATKQLDVLLKALAPVMKDYEAQVAAKAGYEPLRKDTETRVQRLEAADPQTPDLQSMRTDLSTGLDAAGKSAASKDYVAGLKSLNAMQPDLEAAELVARDARTQKAEFDKEWASAGPRVAEAVSCVPPEAGDLEGKRQDLETGKSQIDEMLTRHDYAAATPLSKDLGARSDAYMAEYAAVVDARTLYEKRLPRIDAKLAEIAKCQFPDLTSLQEDIIGTETTMRGVAGTGSYEQALTHMDQLDALLVKFDEAYENARLGKDFADRKAKLAPRIAKAQVSGFGPVDDISNALSADADAADKAAAGKTYPEALALLDDVEVKLGDYETKRAAQEKARTDYENGAPQLLERAKELASCEYPQLTEKTSAIIALRDQMQTAAEKRDFVVASEHMFKLEKDLNVVETTLETLRAKQTEYDTRLPPLVSRFDASMVSDFATLEDERDALLTARADMESAAKNRDYPLAVDHMNKVERLLNDLDAQLGKIEGLKKQYEDTLKQIEGDLKAAGDCAFDELKTPKAAIVALRTEMLASAQEEDFAVALEKAKALIPLVTEFRKLMVQVEDYRRRLEVLKPRLTTVKGFTYKSLKTKQDDIFTRFGDMTGAASEGKMTEAVTKMGELEKLVTDIIALNEELKKQEAVYKKLHADKKPRIDAIEASKITKTEVTAAATAAKDAWKKFEEHGGKDEYIEAVTQADVVEAKIKLFEEAVDKYGDAKEAYEELSGLALAGYVEAEKQKGEYEEALKVAFAKVTKKKEAMTAAAEGTSPDWDDAKKKAKELLTELDTFRAEYTKVTNRYAAVKASAEAASKRFEALPEDAEEKAKNEYGDAKGLVGKVKDALSEKNLDRAEEKVTELGAALDKLEAKLKTKEQLKAEFEALLASLTPRVDEVGKSRLAKGLTDQTKAVTEAMKTMTDRAGAEDFEGAIKAAPAVEKALTEFNTAKEKLEKTDAVLGERFGEIDKDMEVIGKEIDKLDDFNRARFTGQAAPIKASYADAQTKRTEVHLDEADTISKKVRDDQRALLAEIEKLEDDTKQAKEQAEKDKTTLDKVLEVGEDVVDKVVDKVVDEAWDFVDTKVKGAKNVGKGIQQVWEGDGVLEKLEGVIDIGKGVAEGTGVPRKVKRAIDIAEEAYDTGKEIVDYLKE